MNSSFAAKSERVSGFFKSTTAIFICSALTLRLFFISIGILSFFNARSFNHVDSDFQGSTMRSETPVLNLPADQPIKWIGFTEFIICEEQNEDDSDQFRLSQLVTDQSAYVFADILIDTLLQKRSPFRRSFPHYTAALYLENGVFRI